MERKILRVKSIYENQKEKKTEIMVIASGKYVWKENSTEVTLKTNILA